MGARQGLGGLLFILLIHCAVPLLQLSAEEYSPTPVYIFRGAAGYWPGVQRMAEHVREQHCEPVVCRSSQAPWIESKIVRGHRSGTHTGPLLIIGYSAGASTAAKLAHRLEKHGITVDGLYLIEAYDRPAIPSNVEYCFNIYESRPSDSWFIFRGTPVSEITSRTSLLEIDVARDEKFAAEFGALNHFNIQDDDRIQSLVAQQLNTPHAVIEQQPDFTAKTAAKASPSLPPQEDPAVSLKRPREVIGADQPPLRLPTPVVTLPPRYPFKGSR